MLKDITLPNFGGSGSDATVLQWLVAPGAEVRAGQVIAEIETDKAIAELEAPHAGIVETIDVPEGSDGVAVGTVLARLRSADAGSGDDAGAGAETGGDDVAPASAPVEPGTGPSPNPRMAPDAVATAERVLASPLARRRAAAAGISLDGVAGSGPGGRIVGRDLSSVAAASPSPLADDAGFEPGSYELVPVDRMRRAIADNLARSIAEIPQFSLTVHADLDAMLGWRRAHNASLAAGAVAISVNDLLVWACGRALRAVPAVNSSWTDAGIAVHRQAHVAVAVALDDGLVAPVVRAADTRSPAEIAATMRDLVQRAQQRRLSPADFRGATFTLSNLGMRGIASFTSIPGRPQACILSVGAAEPRPVVRDGEIAIVTQASLTLTCDHRVVDGAVGAAFLERLREFLQTPPG